jgi:hypothetical protein
MEKLYKVRFRYMNKDAECGTLGYWSSDFIERKYQFKSKDAIHDYISKHKTILQNGKTFILIYYYVTKYVVMKVNEYSKEIKD